MIIVMRRDAKEQDIQHMIKQVESLGLKPTVLRGTERTVIAAIGDERVAAEGALESGPGVDEVLPVLAPYKIASLETFAAAVIYFSINIGETVSTSPLLSNP